MIRNFIFLSLLLFSVGVQAQEDPRWLRHSQISPDGKKIVFTYKGDLYTIPTAGGIARQITFHDAHDYQAVWSKDSRKIAFASDRYGNFDIYVMNAEGGKAQRLTYHSTNETPFSFTHDNESVLFGASRQDDVKHRQFPSGSQPELYSVPAQGGKVSQIQTLPMEYAEVSKDGSKLLYHDRKGFESEWRKHQRSAIARDIWQYDMKTGKHTKLTDFDGEDRHPVYAPDGKSFYYLSEESGNFNIHRMDLTNPGKSTQVTSFELHPVRFLSIGDGILSFGFDGELYTMKPGSTPEKVSVKILTQDKNNSDQFVSINGGVEEMAISPDGKEIAFISRGEVFVTSVEESFTKRITDTPERERFITWGPEGKSIVYCSERDGKWGIYQAKKLRKEEPFFFASTLIDESPLLVNDKDNYLPDFSPDGKKMAWI
ncbi:MAG: peptidase S41, partial [Cyclobacteriaceae bacterium]